MKKRHTLLTMLVSIVPLHSAFAETNALIEVKLFKNWIIEGESNFGNLAIKNTGTSSILLAKSPAFFRIGQLDTRLSSHKYTEEEVRAKEEDYREIEDCGDGFFSLLPGETQVYEGRKFYLTPGEAFSEKIRFTVSVYLGKGFWLDSEPLTVNGIVPDSEERLTTIVNNKLFRQGMDLANAWHLVAVTYKNERWLYKKKSTSNYAFPICPLSLTNKIRIEGHEGENLFKILDGDKSMIFHFTKNMLLEGPDENDVLGKWTRERKQKAEVDNAEVRRKKAEEMK